VTPGTLDDRYLRWLYSRVRSVRPRKGSGTYWQLFEQLLSTEFVWIVPNDDNRAEDGKDIRRQWAASLNEEIDSDWLSMGCSFLELLMGLTERLSFEGGNDGASWFWTLIDNLGLTECNDGGFQEGYVEEVTTRVIFRTYDPSGEGGLFPLQNSTTDQREVEIWYQLSEYLLERT
jgi:hypothetical protein